MLQITIPSVELYDEEHNEFITTKRTVLQLEHSLVSISKWESKWCKTFLTKREKTREETIDYARCMTITQNIDPNVYKYLTDENVAQINAYISAPMTASRFLTRQNQRNSGDQMTSELIYYWMILYGIPFECQKWHLNRLIALIDICAMKNNSGGKTVNKKDLAKQFAEINAARRKQTGSRG